MTAAEFRRMESELERIRRSVYRGNPYGGTEWSEQSAERLGLQSILRPRSRAFKQAT
jgi:putative transposase